MDAIECFFHDQRTLPDLNSIINQPLDKTTSTLLHLSVLTMMPSQWSLLELTVDKEKSRTKSALNS
jgi:hypothetical protein